MCVSPGRWDQIRISFHLHLFPVRELSPVPEKQLHKQHKWQNHGWKVWALQQSLAPPPLASSTPTAEMSQHNHRKPSRLQPCKAGGEWCKSDASAKPASLQGGHLGGVCQPRSKRQELRPTRRDAASCGSGREGLAVPAGRCQRRGNQAGCLAAWLSGWQGGCAVGLEITLHRCANSSSAQHLCPHPLSSIPPLRSTAGLTDACKAPEDSAQLPPLSEVRPK